MCGERCVCVCVCVCVGGGGGGNSRLVSWVVWLLAGDLFEILVNKSQVSRCISSFLKVVPERCISILVFLWRRRCLLRRW